MTIVKTLNPIPLARIGGTDLGIPFRAFGDIGYGFGDSFEGVRAQFGGPNWRSPVIVWSKQHDITKPIEFSSSVRGGQQIWDYPHNNPEFNTVLPTDFLELEGRLFAWVMVTKELGNERWCELAYTDDRGATWTTGPRWSASAFRGMRTMLTFDRKPGSEWIDIFSTGGLKRNKGMLRWRVRVKDFLDQRKWEGWCFIAGKWQWVVNPRDDQPSEILPGWKFGEISFRYIQNNAVLSGFDSGDYSIFVKVGPDTDTDWTRAKTYRPVTGLPRGVDTIPQLYGGYIHPDSDLNGTMCLIVSQWVTRTGDPYRAVQVNVRGIAPVVPTVVTPQPVPAPTPAPIPPPAPTPAPVSPPKENPVVQSNDVERIVGAGETTTDYDINRPGVTTRGGLNLWHSVRRILFELTLWTGYMSGDDLRAQAKDPKFAETTHGHAQKANSWGRDNNAQGADIQATQAKILRNQMKLGAKLGVTDLEA